MPAKIEIGGQPCEIIDFDMSNLQNTTLVCRNSPKSSVNNEYYGNRGVTFFRDNLYISPNQFSTATPSTSSQSSILDSAFYNDTNTIDVTIWLIGYFNPKKNSAYQFSLDTTGDAHLYLSIDSTSPNKALIASNVNMVSTNQTVNLKSNQK